MTTTQSVQNLGSIYQYVFLYLRSKADFDVHWETKKRSYEERPCPWKYCENKNDTLTWDGLCYNVPDKWYYSAAGIIRQDCKQFDSEAKDNGTQCVIYRNTGGGVWRNGKCVYKPGCSKSGGCPCRAATRGCPDDFDVVGNNCFYKGLSYKGKEPQGVKLMPSACKDGMFGDLGVGNCGEYGYFCRNEYYQIGQNDCRCANLVGNAGCGKNAARQCAIFNPADFKDFPTGLVVNWKLVSSGAKLYRVKIDLSKLNSSNAITTYSNLVNYFGTNGQDFSSSPMTNGKVEVTYTQYESPTKITVKKAVVYPGKLNTIGLDMVKNYIFYNIPLTNSTQLNQMIPNVKRTLVFFITNALDPQTTATSLTNVTKSTEKISKSNVYDAIFSTISNPGSAAFKLQKLFQENKQGNIGDNIVSLLKNKDDLVIETWNISNNADNINPYFFFNGTDLKYVSPDTGNSLLRLDLTSSSSTTPQITDPIFVRYLEPDETQTNWPSDFQDSKPIAIYGGYLDLDTLILNNITSGQSRNLLAFKKNFINLQATVNLPSEFLNWNKTIYYNFLLPKFCALKEYDSATYCPSATTDYFSNTMPSNKGPCLYMTSNYCSQNPTGDETSSNCDCEISCMSSTGLAKNQQPANSQRTKVILDGNVTQKCNSYCTGTGSSLSNTCPRDCQCLVKDKIFMINNLGNTSNASNIDFKNNPACWFLPCQSQNETIYYVPNSSYNAQCPQTVCQNILSVVKTGGSIYEQNISYSNQCGNMPTAFPPATNPPTGTPKPASQVPIVTYPPLTTGPARITTTPTPFDDITTSTPSQSNVKQLTLNQKILIAIGILILVGIIIYGILYFRNLYFGEEESQQQQQMQIQQQQS